MDQTHSSMDSLEAKASNILQRLREIRAQHCCPHIDRQIDLWVENQLGHSQKLQQQKLHQSQQHPHNHNNILEQSPQLLPQQLTHQATCHRHNEVQNDKQASSERTIGCFLANLKHLESFDSDATESTSSNDSYDELEGFSQEDIPPKRSFHTALKPHYPNVNNTSTTLQQYHRASTSSLPPTQSQYNQNSTTPNQRRASHLQGSETPSSSNVTALNDNFANMANLHKKAIWKWAKERSRLASKWTWLQAQIADLEFRVRGQNDALMQARLHKIPPIPSTLPDSSCSRTVPLSKDFRNRCLIKSTQILSDSSKSSVKFSQVPCVCSSLPQTVAPCLSCKGRYNYLKQSEGENAPLQERASQLDPCCHPVLSLSDDITLGSQISYLLKRETINRKPAKGKPGRKKGSLTAASSTLTNEDKTSGKHVNKKGKYYQGMPNRAPNHAQSGHLKNASSTMIASNKLKRKYRKQSNNQTNNYNDSNSWFRANNNHAHDNNNNSSTTKRNKRIRSTSSINESSLYSDSSNSYRPNHFNNGTNAVRTVTRRRRSEQSAYDINNIVIPYGIAASTRVEILEYKEIMTPSWRVCSNNGTCEETTNDDSVELNNKKEDDELEEDTSDEAYILRHTRGEHEEKKRFSLKPPPKNETSQDQIPADK